MMYRDDAAVHRDRRVERGRPPASTRPVVWCAEPVATEASHPAPRTRAEFPTLRPAAPWRAATCCAARCFAGDLLCAVPPPCCVHAVLVRPPGFLASGESAAVDDGGVYPPCDDRVQANNKQHREGAASPVAALTHCPRVPASEKVPSAAQQITNLPSPWLQKRGRRTCRRTRTPVRAWCEWVELARTPHAGTRDHPVAARPPARLIAGALHQRALLPASATFFCSRRRQNGATPAQTAPAPAVMLLARRRRARAAPTSRRAPQRHGALTQVRDGAGGQALMQALRWGGRQPQALGP